MTRREKCFGIGRPVPMDRNAKARIMVRARALSRRTEAGKAYGPLTAKFLAVLQALLWGFHNSKDGRCFPSYEAIAERAGCARSTVYEAIRALEGAGILTWVNRLIRVLEGGRWRVLRTSNAYSFGRSGQKNASEAPFPSRPIGVTFPGSKCPRPSKSEKPTGTPIQDFQNLEAALGRLRSAMKGGG